MRVLHIATDIRERGGGLAVSVRGLATALGRQGIDIELLSVDAAPGANDGRPHPEEDAGPVFRTFPPAFPRRWGRSPGLLAHLRTIAGEIDVAHLHGLWRHPVTAGARLLREAGVPYVVTLHGLLNPLALAHRGWGKRPYLALLERETLRGASLIHCLSEAEAVSWRRMGLGGRTVVVPNGISAEELSREPPAGRFRDRHPCLREGRIILFLGRLIPAKGVGLLIRALGRVRKDHPDAHLVLAGRATIAEACRLRLLAARHRVRDRVTLTGLLSRGEKWEALADADLFVLPSREEGDSISVLEALSSGLPVILGPGPSSPELRSRGIGWRVEADPGSIAGAIREVLGDPVRAREAAEAGRQWVRSERSWDRIAARWSDVYGDLAGMKLSASPPAPTRAQTS